MTGLVALTREVSPAIANCELTHLARVTIDLNQARAQHAMYERALASLGCDVCRLTSGPAMPDAVFIEDIAIVLDELAILTRPGAPSRRVECDGVEKALAQHRRLVARIEAPGTLDGGDVLVVGRSIFIGVSSRTNAAAVDQVRMLVAPFGYSVHAVRVAGCLHLKSAVTAMDDTTLLLNPAWAPPETFKGFDIIEVDPRERYAANVVRVGDGLVYPTGFPSTRERLETRGFSVTVVDVSELAKAEGAVTCCSLIFVAEKRQNSAEKR